jgi:gamma-glutamyltranspeptidase
LIDDESDQAGLDTRAAVVRRSRAGTTTAILEGQRRLSAGGKAGSMTAADLADYQPMVRMPTVGRDRGDTIKAVSSRSSGGSAIINSVFDIRPNLIDHGMNMQAAIDAPRRSATRSMRRPTSARSR